MKTIITFIFIVSLSLPLTSNAEITCHIEGGKKAGLNQKTIQKLYYDVFKAVKRLGWTQAKDLKSCDSGNMKFTRLPMLTTNSEIIVFDTRRAVIQYAKDAFTREYLCYDMKLKKGYRKSNGKRCP